MLIKDNLPDILLRKSLDSLYITVGENIIATIKMRNNFWYPLKMVIFPMLR